MRSAFSIALALVPLVTHLTASAADERPPAMGRGYDGPQSIAAARDELLVLVPDAERLTTGRRSHYGSVPFADQHPDPLRICGRVNEYYSNSRVTRRRCFQAQDLPLEYRQYVISLQGARAAKDADAAARKERSTAAE